MYTAVHKDKEETDYIVKIHEVLKNYIHERKLKIKEHPEVMRLEENHDKQFFLKLKEFAFKVEEHKKILQFEEQTVNPLVGGVDRSKWSPRLISLKKLEIENQHGSLPPLKKVKSPKRFRNLISINKDS